MNLSARIIISDSDSDTVLVDVQVSAMPHRGPMSDLVDKAKANAMAYIESVGIESIARGRVLTPTELDAAAKETP